MLGDTLSSIIDALNEETITLNELMEQGGSEGMLVLCAFCTLPFLIPVSIPGVSTVFGAAIVLIAVAALLQ